MINLRTIVCRWIPQWGVATILSFAAFSLHAAEEVPAIRVTAPNGNASLLIGSVHIGYPGLRQPADSVISKARVLVIEHTLHDEKADTELVPGALDDLRSTGRLRRASWSAPLTGAQLERIRNNYNCLAPKPISSEDFQALLSLKSPRFFSQLAFLPCTNLLGLDMRAIDIAKAFRIPIVPLESQAEIAQRRATIPDRIYVQQLYHGITLDLTALYRSLAETINRGDFEAVHALNDTTIADPQDAALYRQVLLTERNAAWMPALRAQIDAGNAAVVVGAAHLGGPDGLIALLNKAGYRTSLVTVPAAN